MVEMAFYINFCLVTKEEKTVYDQISYHQNGIDIDSLMFELYIEQNIHLNIQELGEKLNSLYMIKMITFEEPVWFERIKIK